MMKPGKRYRVKHQLAGVQQKPRVSVMDYMGKDQHGDHQFSARPLAGTQTLSDADIIEVARVPKNTPIMMNKVKQI